jgi:hypothetical protein
MHLLAQPEVAARLLGNPLYRSQGFLARWLIAAPESLAGTRKHNPALPKASDDPRIRRYWDAIRRLLENPVIENPDVGGLSPRCLALSPDAHNLLIKAYDEFELAQGAGAELEQVREWSSKAAEHACRIAGVIEPVSKSDVTSVSEETLHGALALAEWYLSEYQRLVGHAGVSEDIRRAQLLLDWIKRGGLRTVTARQVMRLGPGSIRSADVARAALRVLSANHWITLGKDASTYLVDPAAFSAEKP